MGIIIEDAVLIDNTLYCISRNYPILICFNLLHKSEQIVNIIDEEIGTPNYGRKILVWQNNVVVTPGLDNKVKIYNITQRTWRSIPIHFDDNAESFHYRMFCSYIYNDELYLFGCINPIFVRCNLVSCKFEIQRFLYERFINLIGDRSVLHSRYSGFCNNNIIYLPLSCFPFLLEFNLKNLDYKWHRLDGFSMGFKGIDGSGDHLWMLSRDGSMITEMKKGKIVNVYCNNSNNIPKDVFYILKEDSRLLFFGNNKISGLLYKSTDIINTGITLEAESYDVLFGKKIQESLILQNKDGSIAIRNLHEKIGVYIISMESQYKELITKYRTEHMKHCYDHQYLCENELFDIRDYIFAI